MNTPINKKAPAPTKTQNAFITNTDGLDYLTSLPATEALLKAHFAEAGYLVHPGSTVNTLLPSEFPMKSTL